MCYHEKNLNALQYFIDRNIFVCKCRDIFLDDQWHTRIIAETTQWKLTTFLDFLIQTAMPCNILSITALSLDVDIMKSFLPISFMSIMAPFLQLHIIRYKVLRNTNIQNEKKIPQIETSFCHANAVKLLFISVQLDSGQFQENSQEYLR